MADPSPACRHRPCAPLGKSEGQSTELGLERRVAGTQGSGEELVSCQGSRQGLAGAGQLDCWPAGSRVGPPQLPVPGAPLSSHHHLPQRPSAEPLACSPTLPQASPQPGECGPGWRPAHLLALRGLFSVQELSGKICVLGSSCSPGAEGGGGCPTLLDQKPDRGPVVSQHQGGRMGEGLSASTTAGLPVSCGLGVQAESPWGGPLKARLPGKGQHRLFGLRGS